MKSNCKINESCLMYMFRYCLSRQSYAVTDAVNAILANWGVIHPLTKDCIIREIKREMEKESLYELRDMDMMEWEKIVDRYEKETIKQKSKKALDDLAKLDQELGLE